jgi:hypothetical protein
MILVSVVDRRARNPFDDLRVEIGSVGAGNPELMREGTSLDGAFR